LQFTSANGSFWLGRRHVARLAIYCGDDSLASVK